jgi:hypothetical protein
VVGAVAMNLHDAPRMTADLDLVVDLERANLAKMLDLLERLGYRPRLPVPAYDLLDERKRQLWVGDLSDIATLERIKSLREHNHHG